MGGQYALAVAAALPQRVVAAAVVAGCPPMDEPATFAALNRTDRALTRLSRQAPPLARSTFAALRAVARHTPGLLARSLARSAPPGERAAWLAHADWLAASMAEALADAHGEVDEYRVWARPWGVDPTVITCPVDLWQGDADPLVPVAYAHRLHELVPAADLHVLAGRGHLLLATDGAEVLERLTTR